MQREDRHVGEMAGRETDKTKKKNKDKNLKKESKKIELVS